MDNMNSNNVVQFPLDRIRNTIAEHASKSVKKIEEVAIETYFNQVVDYYAEFMLHDLANRGVSLTHSMFDKFFALTVECLRASIFKTFDINHPLQEPMTYMIEKIEDRNKNDPA